MDDSIAVAELFVLLADAGNDLAVAIAQGGNRKAAAEIQSALPRRFFRGRCIQNV